MRSHTRNEAPAGRKPFPSSSRSYSGFFSRFGRRYASWPEQIHPDRKIWDYARQNGFLILTADTDFVTLANALGPPPKVILLENCDYPTSVAAQMIRANKVRIAEFEENREPFLILRKT